MIKRVLEDQLIINYGNQNVQREKTISKDAFSGHSFSLEIKTDS